MPDCDQATLSAPTAPVTIELPAGARKLAEQLEVDLLNAYGPLLGGVHLARAVGYPTTRALQQALLRKRLELQVFQINGRRGRFALTKDVASWIARQRWRAGANDRQPRKEA